MNTLEIINSPWQQPNWNNLETLSAIKKRIIEIAAIN